MVKGFTGDMTIARGYPVGGSFHIPVLPTKVLSIYLLAVTTFEPLGWQKLEHVTGAHTAQ